MNIEQIAIEVADELFLDKITIGYNSTEFLHRCLEKFAEQIDMKPTAYLKTWSSVDNAVADKKRIDLTEDSGPWLATNSFPKTDRLYTETQLIAAQLQVAKACVNLCKTLKETEKPQQHSQWNAGIDLCIDQLSSNEWMGHL